jgi:prevent-host-death family protein
MSRRQKKVWQLQEAKARLSDLVRTAATEGPQEITVRGEPAVVVLSRADYDKLAGRGEAQSLAEFLLSSPLAGLNMEFEREQTPTREVGLFEEGPEEPDGTSGNGRDAS